MIIKCDNNDRLVDVGSKDILFSLLSTVMIKLKSIHNNIGIALDFLSNGICRSENALECARQMNLIRDALSNISPQDAVYDMREPDTKAPWDGRISATITSCGNMYTTADGKDLIYEIVSILTYAHYKKTAVIIE